MQISADNYKLFSKILDQSKNVMIMLDDEQSADSITAAVFFENFLNLKNKRIQIIAKNPIADLEESLSKKIVTKIEPPKLLISFDYKKNQIEKVSYKLDGDNFNFIITPKDKKIDPEELSFSYQGKEIDLIICLGLVSLEKLDGFEREYLQNKTILNMDTKSANKMYGSVNIIDEKHDSICSLLVSAIEKSKLLITKEQAEILLEGLRSFTENFKNVQNSLVFESAAFCTKIIKDEQKNPSKNIFDKPEVPKEWLSPKVYRSSREAS